MLLEYLQDYTDRVKPLLDQNELFGKIQTEFEKKWENGTFPGWPVSSLGLGDVLSLSGGCVSHLCKVIAGGDYNRLKLQLCVTRVQADTDLYLKPSITGLK